MSVIERPARPRRGKLVPPQHGAWGFLALPLALGVCAASGWTGALAPVMVAWVAAYPFSWAVTCLVTMPRPERYRDAAALWGAAAILPGVAALVLCPWLVWVLVAYAALFGVNLAFARARSERALANDLVLVAECSMMVPVVAGVATGAGGLLPPWPAMTSAWVLALTAVCALTLVGSTLHVKSLIRERRDRRYARASQAVALVSVPAVYAVVRPADPLLAWWMTVPFVFFAVRSLRRDPTWRPSRIGLVELAGLVLVALAAALGSATV